MPWLSFNVRERNLRSSSPKLLAVPFSKTKSYGDSAFSICAPKLWNDLPLHLRNCASFNVFKSNLKTFLFKYTYTTAENGEVRITWEMTIYTDKVLKHNRPDITLVHKDAQKWTLIDIAVPADQNTTRTERGEG